jgi:hypothetical protein
LPGERGGLGHKKAGRGARAPARLFIVKSAAADAAAN